MRLEKGSAMCIGLWRAEKLDIVLSGDFAGAVQKLVIPVH